MIDLMDEIPIKEFIKNRQKEGLIPKGFINIQNVKSNFVNENNAYSVFKCKIKPFFKKSYYITLIRTSNGKIKEFQGDKRENFDEWGFFKL